MTKDLHPYIGKYYKIVCPGCQAYTKHRYDGNLVPDEILKSNPELKKFDHLEQITCQPCSNSTTIENKILSGIIEQRETNEEDIITQFKQYMEIK